MVFYTPFFGLFGSLGGQISEAGQDWMRDNGPDLNTWIDTLKALQAKLTQLGYFKGRADGAFGEGLVQASDGNFYGITAVGGAHNSDFSAGGTIFRITPSGVLTILYSFCALANCASRWLSARLLSVACVTRASCRR